MTNPLPPIAKEKSVMITFLTSLFFLAYKIVDAIGNADFLLQKLGLSEGAAKFLGSSRMIDVMIALSFGALAISLVYQVNRLMVVAESAPQQGALSKVQSEIKTPDRIVVNVEPDYLTGFFKQHTEVQAKKSVAAYIGKWTKVSGIVHEVTIDKDYATVYIDVSDDISVSLYFHDQMSVDRVEVMRRGERIHAIGQIQRVNRGRFSLENCELLDPASVE